MINKKTWDMQQFNARIRFQRLVRECWATVTMPEHTRNWESFEISELDLVVPFPTVRFVEPFEQTSEPGSSTVVRGVEEILMQDQGTENGRQKMVVISRVVYESRDAETQVEYFDAGEGSREQRPFLLTLGRFNAWTKNRTARFRETPVSRQVRRSLGVGTEYREFVIVRRGDDDGRWKGALSMRKIMPLFRALHTVRAHTREEHLRQLPSGEVVVVSSSRVQAHVRGKGDLVQVKDYRVR